MRLEQERPSKKRRNHGSFSATPDVLNAKKRKRTVGNDDNSINAERDEVSFSQPFSNEPA